ncbi:MAG: HlyD family efflux transporter periplasmic adaptor subunit [Steroidobacteraceae bacterium]
MNSPESVAIDDPNATNAKRRRALLILLVLTLLGTAAWYLWWSTKGRWFESTEDAYAGGTVVQITAEVGGTIRAIHPRETSAVTAGQMLIELDPADARIALDAAVAELAGTVREIRGAYPQAGRLQAQIRARQSELERARDDLRRRESIAGGGAVSAEEIAHAREVLAGAEAALLAAREELKVATAQTAGTEAASHPQVLRAAARVRDASLALERTRITAPVSGVVARKGAQVGQRVTSGTPLMTIVQMQGMWVDANFKEGQLRQMRIGQPVTVRSDLYGGDVVYKGRILGFSPGTGAAFALLPAQNASGNWIKVVQRIPVRIALDASELEKHPLRIGLSMTVEVDLHDQTGPMLAAPTTEVSARMAERAERDERAEALIEQTITANLSH